MTGPRCAWQRRERAYLANGVQCIIIELGISRAGGDSGVTDGAVPLDQELNRNVSLFASRRPHIRQDYFVQPLPHLLRHLSQIRPQFTGNRLTQDFQEILAGAGRSVTSKITNPCSVRTTSDASPTFNRKRSLQWEESGCRDRNSRGHLLALPLGLGSWP